MRRFAALAIACASLVVGADACSLVLQYGDYTRGAGGSGGAGGVDVVSATVSSTSIGGGDGGPTKTACDLDPMFLGKSFGDTNGVEGITRVIARADGLLLVGYTTSSTLTTIANFSIDPPDGGWFRDIAMALDWDGGVRGAVSFGSIPIDKGFPLLAESANRRIIAATYDEKSKHPACGMGLTCAFVADINADATFFDKTNAYYFDTSATFHLWAMTGDGNGGVFVGGAVDTGTPVGASPCSFPSGLASAPFVVHLTRKPGVGFECAWATPFAGTDGKVTDLAFAGSTVYAAGSYVTSSPPFPPGTDESFALTLDGGDGSLVRAVPLGPQQALTNPDAPHWAVDESGAVFLGASVNGLEYPQKKSLNGVFVASVDPNLVATGPLATFDGVRLTALAETCGQARVAGVSLSDSGMLGGNPASTADAFLANVKPSTLGDFQVFPGQNGPCRITSLAPEHAGVVVGGYFVSGCGGLGVSGNNDMFIAPVAP